VLRLQKLTLRIAQPSEEACAAGVPCIAPTLSTRSLGHVVTLPRISQARSRRPSALAMQMGLVPGPSPTQYPISQVSTARYSWWMYDLHCSIVQPA
jgi:hypothetical protein